jgi:hypothetical protein
VSAVVSITEEILRLRILYEGFVAIAASKDRRKFIYVGSRKGACAGIMGYVPRRGRLLMMKREAL